MGYGVKISEEQAEFLENKDIRLPDGLELNFSGTIKNNNQQYFLVISKSIQDIFEECSVYDFNDINNKHIKSWNNIIYEGIRILENKSNIKKLNWLMWEWED